MEINGKRKLNRLYVYGLSLFGSIMFAFGQATAQDGTTQDVGWPRQIEANGVKLIYYQPQIDEWKDYKDLSGRFAFSLTSGGKESLGVAAFKAKTSTDKESRTVYCHDISVTDVRSPSMDAKTLQTMEKQLKSLLPTDGEPISMDRLMADLDRKSVKANGIAVKNDPPEIFYSARPAILLMVEGDPVLAPIEKNSMQFVVNTNWDLFFDPAGKTYYLLVNSAWFKAQALEGPWTQIMVLPVDMSRLPAGGNFDDVRKMVPPPPPSGSVPYIFFSGMPAELLLSDGNPVYTKIPDTQLFYISNTDNDIFLDNSTKIFYVLLSGRWFQAKSLEGKWSYAGNDLPADFAKIPVDSPKATVLSSVPGTTEAADAVMLAQIPTTAVVNKAEAEAKVQVSYYDGTPQFKPIEQTSLQYAVNTEDRVIKDGDLYYLCFQGVWFMSTTPQGPWKTADSVPAEIYTIPPSSPVYNITYVTQTSTSPTTVECSYTAGYFGMFILGLAISEVIIYGTGFYYPPYIYWGPRPYPIYRPWPVTYGMGAVYSPWTGSFAVGRAAYGPYGTARSTAWFNPATGRYGRSATIQTPYGGRTVANAYNPWTGRYGATTQGHNAYAQWGSSVVSRGGYGVHTGHVSTRYGGVVGYRTSTGQHGVVHYGPYGSVVTRTNNEVYAGHDGNIYRKNDNGTWSQYNKGNWNQVSNTTPAKPTSTKSTSTRTLSSPSPSTMEGLQRSEQSRQRGQIQIQRFNNFRQQGIQRPGGGMLYHKR